MVCRRRVSWLAFPNARIASSTALRPRKVPASGLLPATVQVRDCQILCVSGTERDQLRGQVAFRPVGLVSMVLPGADRGQVATSGIVWRVSGAVVVV
jgi:hypothetical protein